MDEPKMVKHLDFPTSMIFFSLHGGEHCISPTCYMQHISMNILLHINIFLEICLDFRLHNL